MRFRCVPVGDQAVSVQFEQVISLEIHRQVIHLADSLRTAHIAGVVELVPAYASLLVYYDPLIVTYDDIVERIGTFGDMHTVGDMARRTVIIPALYGGEVGPDLEDVACLHGLSAEEVIRLHSLPTYHVYMLGFSPGFPYLGGLLEALHTPRLSTPRPAVAAGSIGIAGSQTGIYSLPTPGGWRIIGRTPLPLFDFSRHLGFDDDKTGTDSPFLLHVGDMLRFAPVTEHQYEAIQNLVRAGTYVPQIMYTTGGDSDAH